MVAVTHCANGWRTGETIADASSRGPPARLWCTSAKAVEGRPLSGDTSFVRRSNNIMGCHHTDKVAARVTASATAPTLSEVSRRPNLLAWRVLLCCARATDRRSGSTRSPGNATRRRSVAYLSAACRAMSVAVHRGVRHLSKAPSAITSPSGYRERSATHRRRPPRSPAAVFDDWRLIKCCLAALLHNVPSVSVDWQTSLHQRGATGRDAKTLGALGDAFGVGAVT